MHADEPVLRDVTLDALDDAIIDQLVEDGRATYADIGQAVGVAANTVRNRLKLLLDRDVIEISAYPNPNRGQSLLRLQLAFSVEASKLTQVARQLARSDSVHYLALTSGHFDLVAVATFSDRPDMLDFIQNTVSGTPGILNMRSSVILQVAKSRGLMLPPFKLSDEGEDPVSD